jgi:SAM-dependent methyltransferase
VSQGRPSDQAYVLGTHGEELERLRFQHELWRPLADAAWDRAGLTAGERVLDLGAGPGFAAVDLAHRVGPTGQVLALEHSADYVATGRRLAAEAGLTQLEVRQHDLLRDPLPREGFDLAWMRWVAMFLPDLEPLLAKLPLALRPGARLVAQEYVDWDSFGLHPHGATIHRFGQAVQHSFRRAGGDPDVNRRLPSLLAARGFRIETLTPLPVLGSEGSMAAQWMQRFVAVYASQLIDQGLWSTEEQAEADAEIAAAATDPGSYWVGPTVLELQATRWAP